MNKKLFTLICALTCVLSLSACGTEATVSDNQSAKIQQAESVADACIQIAESSVTDGDSVVELTSNFNKEEMATLFAQATNGVEADLGAVEGLFTTYAQMKKDMGEIIGHGVAESKVVGKEIIVTYPVTGENCDGSMTFTFSNDIFTRFKEGDCKANTTFKQRMNAAGESMGTAGLNTLLGMGTVFSMLILISIIISSFSLFGKIGKKKAAAPAATTSAAPVETAEDLTDDTELVAVIMAAIRAYEGSESTDGFVVRSIKRANRRK